MASCRLCEHIVFHATGRQTRLHTSSLGNDSRNCFVKLHSRVAQWLQQLHQGGKLAGEGSLIHFIGSQHNHAHVVDNVQRNDTNVTCDIWIRIVSERTDMS